MQRRRWRRMLKRYFMPKTPGGVLSWRYFVPRNNAAVLQHRQAFLSAFTRTPVFVWGFITLHSYICWYLFNGWRDVFRCWKQRQDTLPDDLSIRPFVQLKELIYLAFCRSTPPRFYYLFKLYRLPKCEWLDFVYPHELPGWHRMMSPDISESSLSGLTDKCIFAQRLGKEGLPVVETVCVLNQDQVVPENALFQERSFFLKPISGSRKQGCLVLRYDKKIKEYELSDEASIFSGTEAILALVTSKVRHCDYFIQPLLNNDPWFGDDSDKRELITLRVVTGIDTGISAVKTLQPVTISALLELPLGHSNIRPMSINVDSGCVKAFDNNHLINRAGILRVQSCSGEMEGKYLPNWPEIKRAAEMAHTYFPDIATIGWDLALTDSGIRLLEGNINWNVTPHQLNGVGMRTIMIQAAVL